MSEPSNEQLAKRARALLETPFWVPELESETTYQRLNDDHDGKFEGIIQVGFTRHGDATIGTDLHHGPVLRFRTPNGGGQSERVRTALMLLAYAIKLDNEERPIADPDTYKK